MKINQFNDPAGAKSPVTRSGDLLARLNAGGSVQAVVIRVLQDNLLLSTRLGEILTRNTLDLHPGERLQIRLDRSGAEPVLRAARQTSAPIEVKATLVPRLQQLLLPEQPRLAEVVRVMPAATEIRLAEQSLVLPRRLPFARGELIGLQRDAARDRIEITRQDKKPIYRALLQQLLPRQATRTDDSLTRLVNRLQYESGAHRAPAAQHPHSPSAGESQAPRVAATVRDSAAPRSASVPTTGSPVSIPARQAIAQAGSKPAPAAEPTTRSAPAPATATVPPAPTRSAAPAAIPALRAQFPPTPDSSPAAARANGDHPHTAQDAPRPKPVLPHPAQPQRQPAVHTATFERPGKSPAAANPVPAPARPAAGVEAMPAPTPPAVAARNLPAPPLQSIPPSAPRASRSTPSAPSPALQAAAAANAVAPSTAPPAASQPGVEPAFLGLLRLIPQLAQIDKSTLIRWFELNGLLRNPAPLPAGESAPTTGAQAFRAQAGGNLAEILDQLLQPRTQGERGQAEPGPRTASAELPQLLPREGIKLVEQSIAQNLLQRASAGMQQESQQPLNLSLALPVFDGHEARPLSIRLQQRSRAPDDEDASWDIRLNFEFGALGPICCHLFVHGLTVAASFYSEFAATRTAIQQALPELQRQLSRAGFNPAELHSFDGARAPATNGSSPAYDEALIDIEV